MKKEEIQEIKSIAKFVGIEVTDFEFNGDKTLVYGDENDAMDFRNLRFYNPSGCWNELIRF